jgi:hypothetical protein
MAVLVAGAFALPVAAHALEVRVTAPGETDGSSSANTGSPTTDTGPPGSSDGSFTVNTGSPGAGAEFAPSDTLIASFALGGILDPDEENPTLGEGMPATLTIVVDLWRDRSGWWDSLVQSRTYVYRFRRDVWSGVYEVVNPDGTRATLPGPPALRAYLERAHDVPLGTAGRYDAGKTYYLTVKVVLEPLDPDDLEEVEAWLSGDVTGGPAKGGLLGIPRALYRLAVDLSGLGTESCVGRSKPFRPRP